jgi:hypothetical protein
VGPAEAAVVFASSFALVFVYGFQSRTVQAGRYGLAFACSSLIGVMQAIVTRAAVGDDLMTFLLCNCLGGSFGIVASIWVYQHFYAHKDKR